MSRQINNFYETKETTKYEMRYINNKALIVGYVIGLGHLGRQVNWFQNIGTQLQ